jgi:hypothetical protein
MIDPTVLGVFGASMHSIRAEHMMHRSFLEQSDSDTNFNPVGTCMACNLLYISLFNLIDRIIMGPAADRKDDKTALLFLLWIVF